VVVEGVCAAVFGVGGGYFSLVSLINFLFLHNFFEDIDDFSGFWLLLSNNAS